MHWLLHWLSLVGLAIWLGGFTFYSGVVIPALHEVLGSVETGYVTQQVTNTLNLIGVLAIVPWWVLAIVERAQSLPRQVLMSRLRLGLVVLISGLLAFLIVLHSVMDRRLEGGSLAGFYPLHRVYLIASTAQWAASLALIAVWVGWSKPLEGMPRDLTPRLGIGPLEHG